MFYINKMTTTVKTKQTTLRSTYKTKANISKYLTRGNNIKFVRTNNGWNFVGKNAYNWKDNVKALGANWDDANKVWHLKKTAKLGPIRKIFATLKRAKREKKHEKQQSLTRHLQKGLKLKITRTDEGWHVSGKSAYDWKEDLKALGGVWEPRNKIWVVNGDIAPLRHILANLRKHFTQKDYQKRLEEFDPQWRCCDKMKVVSFVYGKCAVHCPGGVVDKRGCQNEEV